MYIITQPNLIKFVVSYYKFVLSNICYNIKMKYNLILFFQIEFAANSLSKYIRRYVLNLRFKL